MITHTFSRAQIRSADEKPNATNAPTLGPSVDSEAELSRDGLVKGSGNGLGFANGLAGAPALEVDRRTDEGYGCAHQIRRPVTATKIVQPTINERSGRHTRHGEQLASTINAGIVTDPKCRSQQQRMEQQHVAEHETKQGNRTVDGRASLGEGLQRDAHRLKQQRSESETSVANSGKGHTAQQSTAHTAQGKQ